MGWTSFPYQESEHLNWNFHQALNFAENNFGTEGFSIKRFYLEKARTMHDRNKGMKPNGAKTYAKVY